jgi:hypothetical protein
MADSEFSRMLAKASADLRAMSTEVRREVRPALVEAAQPIVAQAKANASWSTRIPGAIRARVVKRGVDIVVSRKKAPHARPLEGITGANSFRHPVMGNRDVWVSQPTRPFLDPAMKAHRGKVRARLARIVSDAAKRHGYR